MQGGSWFYTLESADVLTVAEGIFDVMMKEILIHENAGLDRSGEYVRVAVPCSRGELPPLAPLAILDPAGQLQPVQAQILKQWPDGSVKWLLIDFAATVLAGSTAGYRLVSSALTLPVPAASVQVTQGADSWMVDTGIGSFTLDARQFIPFSAVLRQGKEVLRTGESSCLICDECHVNAVPIIDDMILEDDGPLVAVVRMSGRFIGPSDKRLRFSSRLYFTAGSMAVKVEFTLHNPQAARHSGGLWDLGDEGSYLFRELAFAFGLVSGSATETHCIPEPGASQITIAGESWFSIYQESSGGENWKSPVHRNRDGEVPFARNGYVVEVGGSESVTGLRGVPLVWCGNDDMGVSAIMPHFWQDFPNEIGAGNDQLKVNLFPARFPDLHELQGGEQKTQTFAIDFAATPDSITWALNPLKAVASPSNYRKSGIFQDLPGEKDLVDSFVTAGDIMLKREAIDEYGWRNFGEIYADHEAVYHVGSDPFISHYNNQYDFIAGAYRKFFATGEWDWQVIATDLAHHVLDIDLYHTDDDREEYNHGIFWHTDHYIDAGLSSHRSFSHEHLKTKDPRFCGGGPGAEHCYTSGLMMHYFQTGNPDFKEAVIKLAKWELKALAGPQTVLAALKRGVGYVNLWRTTRGDRPLFPRYPLTRGTGNAITACLDAFEVGGGHYFLDRVDELIRNTLHPGDDILRRDLLNAEIAWSYTVLLSAMAKFLDKKTELNEHDAGFAHARASLITYAEWMLVHEYPYLEKSEILEYPNETWAAQDLRKSVIFYHAARYADSSDQQDSFMQKASFFFDHALEELPKHQSSSYTRPVVLMLQNGWVGSVLNDSGSFQANERQKINGSDESIYGRPTPSLTLVSVISRMGSEVIQALGQTNIKRELAWLRARVQR